MDLTEDLNVLGHLGRPAAAGMGGTGGASGGASGGIGGDETAEYFEDLVDGSSVDACLRIACRGLPSVTGPSVIGPSVIGPSVIAPTQIPSLDARVDPTVVASMVAALRTKAGELDASARAIYVKEHARVRSARASQASIKQSAREIQSSLDAMQESMARLGSDVAGSLKRLTELERGLERVGETKEVATRSLETLERVEDAERLLRGDGGGSGEALSPECVLYHAARLYAASARDVASRQVSTLPGMVQRVHAMRPLIDARVIGLVTRFLEEHADQAAVGIGRDAMSGVRIASGRYRLDSLSWAVVVSGAYGGDLGRVRGMYVEHREAQLGALLERASFSLDFEAVVGFFLVEVAVSRLLETKEFLKTMWEGVAAAIGADVGAALDACTGCGGWQKMLEIKQKVVRGCGALDNAGRSYESYELLLDTEPLISSLVKRSEKYDHLVGLAFVNELEASGEDVERIDEAVRGCCARIGAWLEGMEKVDRVQATEMRNEIDMTEDLEARGAQASAQVDGILCDVIEQVMRDLSVVDERDVSVTALLSLLETVSCMLTSLKDVYGGLTPGSKLQALMEQEGKRAGRALAEKTFADSMAVRAADGDEKGELLSSWSDAMIEQFEFSRDELLEYVFGPDIVGWYAAELRGLVKKVQKITPRDAAALEEALGGRTGE